MAYNTSHFWNAVLEDCILCLLLLTLIGTTLAQSFSLCAFCCGVFFPLQPEGKSQDGSALFFLKFFFKHYTRSEISSQISEQYLWTLKGKIYLQGFVFPVLPKSSFISSFSLPGLQMFLCQTINSPQQKFIFLRYVVDTGRVMCYSCISFLLAGLFICKSTDRSPETTASLVQYCNK